VEFEVGYVTATSAIHGFVKANAPDIEALARISALEPVSAEAPKGAATAVIPISQPPIELRIDLTGLVNVEEESKRVAKEIEKVTADIEFIAGKLGKETFRAKAPPELVAKEEKRKAELEAKRTELEASLKRLASLGGKSS
jgi:valyl-tRNA synthetase